MLTLTLTIGLLGWCWIAATEKETANAASLSTTVRVADVTWKDPRVRKLWRIFRCETGYLPGRRVNWRHHNSTYTGAPGFAHSTWRYYKRFVRPVPRAEYASSATPREQYAVALVLVQTFGGYSSWPACHRRLGIY